MSGICFWTTGNEPDWGSVEDFPGSLKLYATWGSHALGFVDILRHDTGRRAVTISHFATWKENRGYRVEGASAGEAMAHALRDVLRTELAARRIIFQEIHTHYAECGYPRFFRRLGAVPRERSHRLRAAWHWDWTGPVEGQDWLGDADMRGL